MHLQSGAACGVILLGHGVILCCDWGHAQTPELTVNVHLTPFSVDLQAEAQ